MGLIWRFSGPFQCCDSVISSEIRAHVDMVGHSMGSLVVFVGLRGTKEELGIKATNYWIYPQNDLDDM